MALRNFWMTANVDGRANEITGGPRSRNGEMTIRLAQRQVGESLETVRIECQESGGVLETVVHVLGHDPIIVKTER